MSASATTGRRYLGLFPHFAAGAIGGVEASARTAWSAVVGATRDAVPPPLLIYGAPRPGSDRTGAVSVTTRQAAIRAALGHRWRAGHALVWHLDLLRLAPLCRIAPQSCVVFLHGIEVWRPRDPLTRLLLARAGLVLTNSDFTWERACATLPALRGRPHLTVHLGLDAPIAGPSPAPGAPPAALIVGRMHRGEGYKGHRELVLVWPLLRRIIPDAELWVAGEGDLRPELERLAQECGVGAAVRFLGRVSEEQKHELLSRCRCLAMPSRGEGFGLVYLEAMRLGRPCLVSDADAGREVVGPPEAGLAVDPGDPAALAASLARLLTLGRHWDSWSAQARARYERQFTAAHFQRRLLSALGLEGQRSF